MTDEAVKYTVPAITLGYAVVNDLDGKFTFWNEKAVIKYRDGQWQAEITLDEGLTTWRIYGGLLEALELEAEI